MQIEAGKKYRMRNGCVASVECEHPDEPIYPFYGKCFGTSGAIDRIAYWMPNGRYAAVVESGFDITEELN